MKKYLLTSTLFLTGIFTGVSAQENLAPDQNPNYAVSRDKYMGMADSINQWHSTTIQQTYKAYDWYEQRQERRNERIQFRRTLRLERARGSYYYQPYYNGRYDRYNSRYNYNRYNRNWWNFWCF